MIRRSRTGSSGVELPDGGFSCVLEKLQLMQLQF